MTDSTPLASVIFKVKDADYMATLWQSAERPPIWIVRGHGKVWYLPPGGDPSEAASQVRQRFLDYTAVLDTEGGNA
jgi:hypothetical protein